MNSEQRERTLAVIEFLENLPPENFNLWIVAKGGIENLKEIAKGSYAQGCGAAACVVGWLPAIFPDHFFWTEGRDFFPNVRSTFGRDVWDDAASFLGVPDEVFYEDEYHEEYERETGCSYDCGCIPKEMVIRRLRGHLES